MEIIDVIEKEKCLIKREKKLELLEYKITDYERQIVFLKHIIEIMAKGKYQ